MEQKNNQGMTLIELVVAVAIMGVLSLTIGRLLTVSTGQFQSLFGNAAAQTQSQDLADRLNRLIVNVNVGISYEDAENKTLTLYSRESIDTIRWKQDKTVSYRREKGEIKEKAGSFYFEPSEEGSEWIVLSEEIEKFHVELSETPKNGTVTFSFVLSGAKEKEVGETVTLRNKVKINQERDMVYKTVDSAKEEPEWKAPDIFTDSPRIPTTEAARPEKPTNPPPETSDTGKKPDTTTGHTSTATESEKDPTTQTGDTTDPVEPIDPVEPDTSSPIEKPEEPLE